KGGGGGEKKNPPKNPTKPNKPKPPTPATSATRSQTREAFGTPVIVTAGVKLGEFDDISTSSALCRSAPSISVGCHKRNVIQKRGRSTRLQPIDSCRQVVSFRKPSPTQIQLTPAKTRSIPRKIPRM